MIMSDHGFGPFHKFIHVNNWLLREKFMAIEPGLRAQGKRALFNAGFSPMNVYDSLMRLGLGALKREVVRGQGQGFLKRLFLSFDDVDWAHTRAYSLGNVGQIRINLAGREPLGCVQPGAEYEQVRSEIIERLASLRDPQTGEAVIETVYRREELYSGDYLDEAADIIFLPRRLEYFGFGEYEFGSHKIIEAMKRGISGTHRMKGIFMAYGAAVRAGAQVQDASLVDLAPTILHLMGEAVPAHMDGRVLHEALQADFKPTLRQPTAATANSDSGASGGPVLSADEQKVLAERLRSLGYVG